MKSVFKDWPALERKLKKAKRPLLGLDFDGTLAPVMWHPKLTRMDLRARAVVRTIARRKACEVALISGRSLADLQRRAIVAGAHYGGNHGIEINGTGYNYVHPKAKKTLKPLAMVAKIIDYGLKGIRGAYLENKKYSLSLHFKQTPPRQITQLAPLIEEAVNGNRLLEIVRGKKVFEVRPACRWEKGDALMWLAKRLRADLPIFIGDDAVDEDAIIKAKKAGGIGVHVGLGQSQAGHFIDRQSRVADFLDRVLGTRLTI
jgi:trehalose-phosphatase